MELTSVLYLRVPDDTDYDNSFGNEVEYRGDNKRLHFLAQTVYHPDQVVDNKETPRPHRDVLGGMICVNGNGLRNLEKRRGNRKEINEIVEGLVPLFHLARQRATESMWLFSVMLGHESSIAYHSPNERGAASLCRMIALRRLRTYPYHG